MQRKRIDVPSLGAELDDAELGDRRLNRRLGCLAERLAERPGESFLKALDDAALEGAYRFFGNEKVTPEGILGPHFRQTACRAAELKQVLVIHDTTEFEFSGQSKRRGLVLRQVAVQPPGAGAFVEILVARTDCGGRRVHLRSGGSSLGGRGTDLGLCLCAPEHEMHGRCSGGLADVPMVETADFG